MDGLGARQEKEEARAAAPARRIGDLVLARLADLEERVERELGRNSPAGPAGQLVLDLTRSLWSFGSELATSASSVSGLRGLLASWTASGPVDELGFDHELAESVREILRPLARRWLGLQDERSAALPPGGVLILLNRSAWPLPLEPLILWSWLADGRLGGRRFAVMWDGGPPELPWISDFLRRIGLVTASAANATALLERGFVVLAFPEGNAASTKTYDRRYRLARFEAAELFPAALEAGARIVPGSVIGNEESWPLLGRLADLPVTPQFPLFGLAGLLPLPVAWTLRLGPALELPADADPEGAADAARVRMQAMTGDLLARRASRRM